MQLPSLPSVLSLKAVLIAAAVALVVGFGAGWVVNGWRMGHKLEAMKAEAATRLAEAQEQAARRTAELQKGVDDAQSKLAAVAATIQQRDEQIAAMRSDLGAMRAVTTRLRADSDRLRGQLASYATGAAQSHAACLARVDTLARLASDGDDLLRAGAAIVAASAGVAEQGRAALQGCSREHAVAVAQVRAVLDAWPKP